MRISGRNWFIALAIAVLVHAGIAFGWLFLSASPRTQAAGEEAVRVSLAKWAGDPTADIKGMPTAPEVPVAREVSPSKVSTIATKSPVVSEMVRDTAVEEAADVLPNENRLQDEVEPQVSTEVSSLADFVFDIATAVKPDSTEELPARVDPIESEQPDTEQAESARVNTPKRAVPSASEEQVSSPVEQALDTPTRDLTAKQEESGNGSAISPPGSAGLELSALPQGEFDQVANEEGDSELLQKYLNDLLPGLNTQKRYPPIARRRGVTGVVNVRFTILADGNLASSELVESSGSRHLDREALRMLSRAQPFPPIPKDLQKNRIQIDLPIVFELH